MSNNKPEIKSFKLVSEFHGHICPGSAIGYKAAEITMKELSIGNSKDEELVCITENDTCAVDAIQVVTGCTFGKGNLIFHDYGKQTYTFINRATGDSLRLSMKDSFSIDKIDPNLSKLREKVNKGAAGEEEKLKLKEITVKVSNEVLNLPDEEIFYVEHLQAEIPKKAGMFKSHKCSECGEMVSDHRKRLQNGNVLCIPCFDKIKDK